MTNLIHIAGKRATVHLHVRVPELDRRLTSERSEEHTSELQSHLNLVCRLLLEKKKTDVDHIWRSPACAGPIVMLIAAFSSSYCRNSLHAFTAGWGIARWTPVQAPVLYLLWTFA